MKMRERLIDQLWFLGGGLVGLALALITIWWMSR
jgi:hypothetical protein